MVEDTQTTAEKIAQFRKKYNRDTFIEHLKEQTAKGKTFGFNVQKVIDGTETDDNNTSFFCVFLYGINYNLAVFQSH